MKRLKFLMTSSFYPPYHVGGDANHVKYLAEALAGQGHEVHVMFSVDAYRIKRGGMSKPDDNLGPVHLHPLRSSRGRWEPLLVYLRGRSGYFAREFDRLLREISPDVVHHHNVSLLGYDLLEKRGSHISAYTAHDYWLVCQRNDLMQNGHSLCNDYRGCFLCSLRYHRPPQLWRWGHTLTRAIKNVDLAIAPSGYLGSVLSSALGVPFATLHNFIPAPPDDALPSESQACFLYLGRLEEDKGVMDLIKVFESSYEEMNAPLVVVGTGSLETTLRAYVERRGLQSRVQILGWSEQDVVDSLLSTAVALVIPSVWPENCPLVALEAMSRGTPVIASSMGGLPEIAGLQGEGFVYGPGQLKDALVRVRNAPPCREEVKDVYLQHFTSDMFISRYLDLIGQATANTYYSSRLLRR